MIWNARGSEDKLASAAAIGSFSNPSKVQMGGGRRREPSTCAKALPAGWPACLQHVNISLLDVAAANPIPTAYTVPTEKRHKQRQQRSRESLCQLARMRGNALAKQKKNIRSASSRPARSTRSKPRQEQCGVEYRAAERFYPSLRQHTDFGDSPANNETTLSARPLADWLTN